MRAVKLGDEPVAASTQGGGAPWVWAVLGAGLALALAGIALLLGMRRVRPSASSRTNRSALSGCASAPSRGAVASSALVVRVVSGREAA